MMASESTVLETLINPHKVNKKQYK